MLRKLHFAKTNNRFNFKFIKFKSVVCLCLASICSSLPLFAASEYQIQEDHTVIFPELDKALSEKGMKKAHALADYAFACIKFKDNYTLSESSLIYFLSAVKNDPNADTPLRILSTYWRRTGDLDSLLKNLLPIAKKSPKAIKLNIIVAAALIDKNRLNEAATLLENSLSAVGLDDSNEVSPNIRARLILQLTKIYSLQKSWDKGEELLDDVLDVEDLKNLVLVRLSAALFYAECADVGPDGFFAGWNKRRYRRKLEANLAKLEELCSNVDVHAITLYPILDIYKRYSMDKRAEDLILSQLLINPDDPEAFILLAKVYYDNKKYTNAFRIWKMLVEAPQYSNVRRAWARIYPGIGRVENNIYYQLGDAALKCRNWEEAVKAFNWGLLNNMGEPIGIFKLGFAYMQMGKFEKALSEFKQLSDSYDARYFMAYCYRMLGQWDKALNAIEEAEKVAQKYNNEKFLSRDFYMEYIFLADKAKEFETAEMIALKLLKKYPDDPAFNNFLGYSWADRDKNLADAERMIRIALDSDKTNPAFLDSMAWVLYREKKYSSAFSYIQDAIKASKEPLPDAVILDHYGDICYAMGKEEMALKQWLLALEVYSNDLETEKVEKKIENLMKKLNQ